MFDIIKKTMLTGVGLAVVTKDKVEKLTRELVKKGAITEKEGKELIDDMLQKAEQARKDLETNIESIVQKVLGKIGVVTKEDLARLEEKINKIDYKKT